MKTNILALCLAAATATAAFAAAPVGEIKLTNGAVYQKARIVAINGDQVTIVHSGGSVAVASDQVDLEVLARATMDLEDAQSQRALRAELAKAKAETKKAEGDRAKKERLDLALAESAARSGELRTAAVEQRQIIDLASRVAALKAAFPAKSPGNARVFIPKSGKNNRPYIVSSTVSQLPGGNTYASTTTQHNAGPGRIDTIQYDAPPAEVWGWYQGVFRTTTLQALPRTLELVEKKLAEDMARFQQASGGSSMSGAAQAQHTLYWFNKVLRPYMAEWRAVLK